MNWHYGYDWHLSCSKKENKWLWYDLGTVRQTWLPYVYGHIDGQYRSVPSSVPSWKKQLSKHCGWSTSTTSSFRVTSVEQLWESCVITVLWSLGIVWFRWYNILCDKEFWEIPHMRTCGWCVKQHLLSLLIKELNLGCRSYGATQRCSNVFSIWNYM